MIQTTRRLDVIHGGALTTVQDRGRGGWRHLGVAHAGALDPAQAALANRMVGNPADAAVLELTMRGPTLEFSEPIRIASCGADIDASFEDARGASCDVPCGRPVALPAGRLTFSTIRSGLRAWLAIAGGIDSPRVLGSRSTDLRGGFGGIEGRELRPGDVLTLGPSAAIHTPALHAPLWWIGLNDAAAARDPIRYLANDTTWASALAERAWTVDPRSNRQGLRCAGDAIVAEMPEQVSAPVAPGTIQLPPDGRPIVLLADAQTIGGYPRLGYVIAADLSRSIRPQRARRRSKDATRSRDCSGRSTAHCRNHGSRNRRCHVSISIAISARAAATMPRSCLGSPRRTSPAVRTLATTTPFARP
jgi:5-oxoprolinase (ATP-hydrolysing) subunit C